MGAGIGALYALSGFAEEYSGSKLRQKHEKRQEQEQKDKLEAARIKGLITIFGDPDNPSDVRQNALDAYNESIYGGKDLLKQGIDLTQIVKGFDEGSKPKTLTPPPLYSGAMPDGSVARPEPDPQLHPAAAVQASPRRNQANAFAQGQVSAGPPTQPQPSVGPPTQAAAPAGPPTNQFAAATAQRRQAELADYEKQQQLQQKYATPPGSVQAEFTDSTGNTIQGSFLPSRKGGGQYYDAQGNVVKGARPLRQGQRYQPVGERRLPDGSVEKVMLDYSTDPPKEVTFNLGKGADRGRALIDYVNFLEKNGHSREDALAAVFDLPSEGVTKRQIILKLLPQVAAMLEIRGKESTEEFLQFFGISVKEFLAEISKGFGKGKSTGNGGPPTQKRTPQDEANNYLKQRNKK